MATKKRATKNGETTSTAVLDAPPTRPKKSDEVAVKPMRLARVTLSIRGFPNCPLVHHAWGEKALRQIREKKGGNKTKDRGPFDPEKEAYDAMHRMEDGSPGLPCGALRKCVLKAAHKDIGFTRVFATQAIFFKSPDRSNCVPLEFEHMENREDPVRVSNGNVDLRYRPYFYNWSAEVTIEVALDLLSVEDLLNLINRAGFGVGLLEMRPEKGGEYGRFYVDTDYSIQVENA